MINNNRNSSNSNINLIRNCLTSCNNNKILRRRTILVVRGICLRNLPEKVKGERGRLLTI